MASLSGCARGLALSLVLLLAACGGGGGGGTAVPVPTDPLAGAPAPTAPGNEGTVASPVAVSVGVPRSSSVSVLTNSYYSFTTASTDTYRIALTNPSADVSWFLYSDPGFSTQIQSCDNVWGAAGNETCYVNLSANTTYYLRVSGFAMNLSAISYTLDIRPVTSDGTAAAPVDLSVGGPSRASSVSLAAGSYYRFLTGNAGAYTVGVTNSKGLLLLTAVQLEIYASPLTDVSPVLLRRCSLTNNPSCTVNGLAASTSYYVKVIGSGGGGVEYDIAASTGVSEGSVAAPVVLTLGALPRGAAVDAYGTSYYRFTTEAIGGEYLLSTVTTAGSLGVVIYTDPLFQNQLPYTYCYGGQTCTPLLEPLTTYYVAVTNSASIDVSYQIGVARGLTEGTSTNPVTLTVGAPPHSAAVAAGDVASYVFTTTAYAGSYTIALTGTQRDLKWRALLSSTDLFRRVDFTCDKITTAGPGDETCATPNLEPNTTYTLTVTNKDSTGSSAYNIGVTAGGGSEGAYYTPVPLSGLSYSGRVKAGGYSYYSFTTGPKALTYMVTVANMQSNLGWILTEGSSGSGPSVLDCNNYTYVGDTSAETCATSDRFSSTAVLAANTTYRLRVNNTNDGSAVDSTFDLTLLPLDPAAGCDATATQCFGFEDGLVPAAFVQTSNTQGQQWKWSVDAASPAASGSRSLRTGSLGYPGNACFSYAPAVKPAYVSFSVNRDSGNSFSFTASDGATTAGYSPADSGIATGWRRIRVDTSRIAGAMTLQWCVQVNSTTPVGSDIIWVDDIELK